ncbi:MAG: DEAD/DEAH box helicase [Planctomycetes bacterium]|nr:DEAD/DEAH box helicase [Planctomycetota bacterium]
MTHSSFEALSIAGPILRSLHEEGYTQPTEVQRNAIPFALSGKDVLAVAPTGTGKTAAFTIPILQHLSRKPAGDRRPIRALILTPTRELALQVQEAITAYGRHLSLHSTVVMGGVNMNPQIKAVRRGVDVLVATPGRLLDLMQQGHVKLDQVEFFVLDEADRMLDMGFIHDVRKIASRVPAKRQTLFFSATMPGAVAELANSLLKEPVRVEVTQATAAANRPNIEQRLMFVGNADKQNLLAHLLQSNRDGHMLVFARTKHRADKIVRKLQQVGVRSGAIHSNKTQSQRQRTLADFAEGRIRVLIATDLVARGIDVDGITHVINYDLSDEPENHVHRIGRTARAGASGKAISFCDPDELSKLRQIEKLAGAPIEVDENQPYHHAQAARQRQERTVSVQKKSGGFQPARGPRQPRWQKARGKSRPQRSRRQPVTA